MVLLGDDISDSPKSVANLQVNNYTQKEVIDFLTHQNLGVQIKYFTGGAEYTTRDLIITYYLSNENLQSISITNKSSSRPFIKHRF
ncbi:MAG TPA: hypothetical protein VFQ58_08565 [Flavisolibacter sp.]|nr:hypothetical protein [Flavisolibacter sp.]